MAFWKQVLIALVVLAIAAYGYATYDPAARAALESRGIPVIALGGSSAPDAAAGRPGGRGRAASVVIAKVMEGETGTKVSSIGTGQPLKSVTLYSRATGIIARMGFASGDRVKAGQLLVGMEDAAEKIAVDQAKVAVEDAQRQYNRYNGLVTSKAVSDMVVSEAQTTLAKTQLAEQAAQVAYDQRHIFAPFDGVTGITDLQPGALLTTTTPIVTLDDRSQILVEFRVPEDYVDQMKIGVPVAAQTPAFPGRTFPGKISEVSSRVESDTRTLVARASLANADDALRPGMSFGITVSFPGRPTPSVPPLALQWDRRGAYVWKVADGKAERVDAQILERTDAAVLISAALAPGDDVVVQGVQSVRPNMPVTVLPANGAGPAGGKKEAAVAPAGAAGQSPHKPKSPSGSTSGPQSDANG